MYGNDVSIFNYAIILIGFIPETIQGILVFMMNNRCEITFTFKIHFLCIRYCIIICDYCPNLSIFLYVPCKITVINIIRFYVL